MACLAAAHLDAGQAWVAGYVEAIRHIQQAKELGRNEAGVALCKIHSDDFKEIGARVGIDSEEKEPS